MGVDDIYIWSSCWRWVPVNPGKSKWGRIHHPGGITDVR